jgi:hypothetical protein
MAMGKHAEAAMIATQQRRSDGDMRKAGIPHEGAVTEDPDVVVVGH